MDAFGPTLDYFCGRQGIKLQELAEQIGVSRNTLTNWKARGRPPNQEVTVKLAKFLNLDEGETNTLLTSAGYAPKFPTKAINSISPSPSEASKEGSELNEKNLEEAEDWYRQQVVAIYNRVNFSGFEHSDLFLDEIPLEKIFVRLTLTIEKVIREPVPAEESSPSQKGKDQQKARVINVQEPIELSEALNNHLIIVGEPGAGKSTLLRWLAVTFAQRRQRQTDRLGPLADADRFPVLVELAHLPDNYIKPEGGETPNWLRFLPEFITDQEGFIDIPPQLLTQALRDGRCLLLLDGFDEVAHPAVRLRLAHSLTVFSHLYPGNRLIIGSRPAGVSESAGALGSRFQHTQIKRFTPEEVKRFFQFWYALDSSLTPQAQQNAATHLYSTVQTTPSILKLAATPLLSTLLMLIWRNEGHLPERRIELYERCCRMLVEQWERAHNVPYSGTFSLISWERHLHLLALLAYFIHRQEQRVEATRTEAVQCLALSLLDDGLSTTPAAATLEAEQFLATLGLRSGLLQYLGNDRYGFPHQTFQEYLAARYIFEQEHPIDYVMEDLHKSWWQEIHILTIGLLGSTPEKRKEAAVLTHTLLNIYKPPHVIFRLSIFRSLGKYFPSVQLERRISWVLAREFEVVAKGYSECNLSGMPAIEKELSHKAITWVRHMLSDADLYDAQAPLLTEIYKVLQNNEKVIRLLIELLHSEESLVSHRAAESLGQVGRGNPTVVKALLEILHDKYKDEYLRERVAKSLVQIITDDSIITQLLLDALYDKDPLVRKIVAKGLGLARTNNGFVLQALLQLAFYSKNSNVQEAAIKSLGQIGIGNPDVVQALLLILQDEDWNKDWGVRSAAVKSLAQVGMSDPIVVIALLETLHDSDSSVRREAVKSLEQIIASNPDAIHSLRLALQKQDRIWREETMKKLRWMEIDNPALKQALLGMLYNEHSSKQEVAAYILRQAETDNSALKQALHWAIYNGEQFVQKTALRIVEQAGTDNSVVMQALLEKLHDEDRFVRQAIVQILEKVGMSEPVALQALLEALRDEYRIVRKAAARSLRQVGMGNAIIAQALSEALRDEDLYVREEAARSLGQVGMNNPVAMQALLEALHDEAQLVRKAAARSLGQVGMGNTTIAQALLLILQRGQREDEKVRRAAAKSLGLIRIGNLAVAQALLEALHDKDSSLQEAERLERITTLYRSLPLHEIAAKSLVQLIPNNPIITQLLLKVFHDEDPLVQEIARCLLQARINNETIMQVLLLILQKENLVMKQLDLSVRLEEIDPAERLVSWGVAKSLERVGPSNPAAVQVLLLALWNEELQEGSSVRKGIEQSFEQIETSNEVIFQILFLGLHHKDVNVRYPAIQLLGRMKIGVEANTMHQIILALNRCLYDQNGHIRAVAVVSLRQLLDGQPLPGYYWTPLRKQSVIGPV